jgi:hypothetical protein
LVSIHEALTRTSYGAYPRLLSQGLWFTIAQNSRRSGRLRLKLRYSGVVFGREIHQPFLGERVGLFRETAAALCLFF